MHGTYCDPPLTIGNNMETGNNENPYDSPATDGVRASFPKKQSMVRLFAAGAITGAVTGGSTVLSLVLFVNNGLDGLGWENVCAIFALGCAMGGFPAAITTMLMGRYISLPWSRWVVIGALVGSMCSVFSCLALLVILRVLDSKAPSIPA